jgi:adenylyltransferase/sulfurtransferase
VTFDPHQPDQLARFGRQLQLRQIGPAGQARLGNARAVVVGAGGLGCPAATYLAAAGLGSLQLVDGDRVELSNLNRQTLFKDTDLGRFKAEVAAERLAGTGSAERLTRDNVERLLAGADVVLDASDNFETRFLLADACRILGLPLVQAAVTQFAGQLATYMPDQRPCYRCFFPEAPPDGTIAGCSEAGILGAAAGVMGSLQALEAIKLVSGSTPTTGRLLVMDLWTLSMDSITLPAHPDCPLCGPDAWIRSLADAGTLEAR